MLRCCSPRGNHGAQLRPWVFPGTEMAGTVENGSEKWNSHQGIVWVSVHKRVLQILTRLSLQMVIYPQHSKKLKAFSIKYLAVYMQLLIFLVLFLLMIASTYKNTALTFYYYLIFSGLTFYFTESYQVTNFQSFLNHKNDNFIV